MRFVYLRILLIFCQIFLISACPFAVQQFCACIDQLDGVLLNCTATATSLADEQNARTTQSKVGSKTGTTTIETPATQMMRVSRKIITKISIFKYFTYRS